jgi:phospholipase C
LLHLRWRHFWLPGKFPPPAYAQSWHGDGQTATPIKHLVGTFQENISFDHYFATYPDAANLKGEPAFYGTPGTPASNGLTGTLLTSNPNATNSANGTGATNPFRLDRSQAATADQDHDCTPEQMAFDRGLMDAFPVSVGTAGPRPSGAPITAKTGLTMGYYDGNTVTALWNYAQRYAMSDNSYDTNFGPSTDGAVNLISGTLNGVIRDVNLGGAKFQLMSEPFELMQFSVGSAAAYAGREPEHGGRVDGHAIEQDDVA